MACYLVDYENVNQKGVNGVYQLKLTENDSVIIYYSNSANSLTFELHNELMRTNAKIEYRKITSESKNALDFILVCDLGRFITQNPDEHFYVNMHFDYKLYNLFAFSFVIFKSSCASISKSEAIFSAMYGI